MSLTNKLTIGKLKELLSVIDSKWDGAIINLVSEDKLEPVTSFKIITNREMSPIFHHGQQIVRGKTVAFLEIKSENS